MPFDVDQALGEVYGERYFQYRREWNRLSETWELPKFPLHIDLEMVGKCNLACVGCNRQVEEGYTSKAGLSEETLTKIIDEAADKGCYSLLFGSDDETLIQPDKFLKSAKYALDKGFVDVWLSTNGVLFNERVAKEVIDMKLPRVTISIDAASRETFMKTRRRDRYDQIVANINRFLELREQAKSKLPILRLTFIVMDENEHEKEKFMELWQDKADIVVFQSFLDLNARMEDLTPAEQDDLLKGAGSCIQPFRRMAIHGDGAVFPCCCLVKYDDASHNLGSIHTSSLEDLWNTERANLIRHQLNNGEFYKNEKCKQCMVSAYKAAKTATGVRDTNKTDQAVKRGGLVNSNFIIG